MIYEARCFTRHCKHYKGVFQPKGTEEGEFHYCLAFPEGIPNEIAFGKNNHGKLFPEQENKIVFEEGKFEWE